MSAPRPEAVRLARGMSDLRGRTGLSLAGLAAKTTYSKSSWDRYLGGRTLPPRRAVEELCALAGEPPVRLLALLDLASQADPAAPAPPPAAPPPPVPRRPRARRLALPAAVALGCALAVALGFLLRASPPAPEGPAARCHGTACEGRSPASTFCDLRPVTLATGRAPGGRRIEIRYSPRCLAAWARISGSRVGDRIDVAAAGATHGARVLDRYDTAGYVYTPMAALAPRHTVRVCLVPAGGGRHCYTARAAR